MDIRFIWVLGFLIGFFIAANANSAQCKKVKMVLGTERKYTHAIMTDGTFTMKALKAYVGATMCLNSNKEWEVKKD